MDVYNIISSDEAMATDSPRAPESIAFWEQLF